MLHNQRPFRAPRPSEIAADLGVELGEVVTALQARSADNTVSLDAPIGPNGGTVADVRGDLDIALEHVAYRRELRAALALPARERQMLVTRFFGDQTQTQIVAEIGVSQMHVSRCSAARSPSCGAGWRADRSRAAPSVRPRASWCRRVTNSAETPAGALPKSST